MTFHQERYTPGIYLSYDLPFHMTGIYITFHMTGIYQVYIYLTYDRLRHMSGIYQVYTMIITFQASANWDLLMMVIISTISTVSYATYDETRLLMIYL